MKNGLFKEKKNTLAENIIICAAAALTGTFYYYEYSYGEDVRMIAGLAISAIIVLIWLSCAVKSGRDGKIGFLIFSFLYWSVPYVYTLWYSGRDNLREYNKWLSMSNRVANAMLNDPFGEAADRLGISHATPAAVLLITVMLLYIIGLILGKIIKKKHIDLSDADSETAEDPDEC